jgi:membrane protein DedA with SNARE-associated domain
VINRFPSLKPRADRAFRLLHRYDNIFILSFRFIYGIRISSPVIIGASGVGVKRFVLLNFIAALIWSVSSCVVAYYFADLIMDKFHLLPKIILVLAAVGVGAWYGVYKWRNRASRKAM